MRFISRRNFRMTCGALTAADKLVMILWAMQRFSCRDRAGIAQRMNSSQRFRVVRTQADHGNGHRDQDACRATGNPPIPSCVSCCDRQSLLLSMFYWQLVKNRVIIVECYSGKHGAASRVSHDSSEERTCPFDSLTLRRDSLLTSLAGFSVISFGYVRCLRPFSFVACWLSFSPVPAL